MADAARIQEFFIAYYGRPANVEGLDYWMKTLDNQLNGDELSMASYFGNPMQSEFANLYPADTSAAAFVNAVSNNLFGHDMNADGIQYWVGQYNDMITSGTSVDVARAEMVIYILDGADAADQAVLDNKLAAAEAFYGEIDTANELLAYGSDESSKSSARDWLATITDADSLAAADPAAALADAISGVSDVTAKTMELTSGTDKGADFTGTSGNDFFDASIAQNQFAGGISNSLSSADKLDGAGGTDTLHAELTHEFVGVDGANETDVTPHTTNIEVVTINAYDYDYEEFEEQIGGLAPTQVTNNGQITVDAKYMYGVESIGSKQSDGDLVIENLTTLADDGMTIRNTSEMTITMDHTDSFNSDRDPSDLTVLFDEDYLNITTANTGSTLSINMINTLNLAVGNGDSLIEGFETVTFTVDGQLITVDVAGAEITEVQGLIQDAVDAAGFTDITVSTYQEPAYFGTNIYYEQTDTTYTAGSYAGMYTAFLLTNEGQEELVEGGFTFVDGQNDGSIAYSQDDSESTEITGPISINVELEKVGRDGDGGSLVIGGKDFTGPDTEDDQNDGIQVFNITVKGDEDKPSNLGTISSTNGALDVVTVVSDNGGADTTADLTVRGILGQGQELSVIDATGFEGDFSLSMFDGAQAQQAITSSFGIGNDSYDWASSEADGIDSGKDYSIDMGAGDDTVMAMLDGDSVDSENESFSLEAGNGNDTVTLTNVDENANANGVQPGVSDATTLDLQNVMVSLGQGEDMLNLNSEIITMVNAGSDSDFVRVDADNSDVAGNQADGETGTWQIGTGTEAIAGSWGARVLYEAEVTVDFAGFEHTLTIPTTAANNFVATQHDINAAIIATIEDNPELNRLLDTSLGQGTDNNEILTITSTVQGVNNLEITINQPTIVPSAGAPVNATTILAGEYAALEAGLLATGAVADSAVIGTITPEADLIAVLNGIGGNLDQTGAVSANSVINPATGGSADNTNATSNAIIDMSTGLNDLVALDSDQDSTDTLVFSNNWDKVSVVNFDGTTAPVAGVAEQQTLTFGAAGDQGTQGQVTVTITDSNGVQQTINTPTVGANSIATSDTAAQVAAKVENVITAAGIAGVTATDNLDGTITLDYLLSSGNVAEATLGADTLLTDSQAAATVITTPHVNGTDSAVATNGILVISSAGTSTDTQTVTVTDGNGTTDTITLADTDGNGVVSQVEFVAQVSAFAFTDYTVVNTNATQGLVMLQANDAEATTAVVGGTGDAAAAVGAQTANDGTSYTTANGTNAVAFAAGTSEVQTITISEGADQNGTVTMGIDVDSSGVIEADENFTFTVTAGNEGSVAAELATQINALTGVSAAQGAPGATIDDIIITWDAHVDGTATLDPTATTFLDGAVRSATVTTDINGNTTAVNGTNGDLLDFTAFLNNTDSTSGSIDSAVVEATVFVDVDQAGTEILGAAGATLNAVAVLNGFTANGTETFAAMTEDDLLDALNNDTAYGNGLMNALDAVNAVDASVNVDGSAITSILLVEDDTNDGYYNVYQLTQADAAGTDFTDAELVGVVDFGATLTNMTDGNVA